MDADLQSLFFTSFPIYCLQAYLGVCFFILLIRQTAPNLGIFRYIGENSLFYYAFESVARLFANRWLALALPISVFAKSVVLTVACLVMLTCVHVITTKFFRYIQQKTCKGKLSGSEKIIFGRFFCK